MDRPITVALEIGAKRTFASAIEWPGWARSGSTGDDALARLVEYGSRFALVVAGLGLEFAAPIDTSALLVVERLTGTATTDFGAPGVAPEADEAPLDGTQLDRHVRLLEATWAAFDRAAALAQGVALRTGPRGGGRDLAKMTAHVVDAEQAYIGQLGGKGPSVPSDPFAALGPLRAAALEALRARARGDLPDVGARGGKRWTARYFVRRAAWHVLDHAWEIEDRAG